MGITGNVILEQEQRQTFNYSLEENISKETALTGLIQAKEDLKEMADSNFTTVFIEDTLYLAQRYYLGYEFKQLELDLKEEKDIQRKKEIEALIAISKTIPPYEIEKQNYTESYRLTQLIAFRKKQAYEISDTIGYLQDIEREYRKEGIDTKKAQELISNAVSSFKAERYEEAENYLIQTYNSLEESKSYYQKLKNVINLTKNFFIKYWWQSSLFIIFLIIITPPLVIKIRKILAKRKKQKLIEELAILKDLIKKAQEDYFKNKVISKTIYDLRIDRYLNKIRKIKHTIPVLDAIIRRKYISFKK
ncbi:MAG: hypothetical protein ACTSWZ_03160 [Candidatus Heimdallarchaeaceae archaeon]